MIEVDRIIEIEKIVTKEVPVEVEVIKEVIKEVNVPVQLTSHQEFLIQTGRRVSLARADLGPLNGIGSVRVSVALSDELKAVANERRLEEKLELRLRQVGLNIEKDARILVALTVEGVVDDRDGLHLYRCGLEVTEGTTSLRDEFKPGIRIVSTIWDDGTFGYASKKLVPDAIEGAVENLLTSISNAYLGDNQEVDAP